MSNVKQDNELSRLKIKIRGLSAKTVANGCTEAEAFSAMEKVGELLEQYNLTLTDCMLKAESCIEKRYWSGKKRRGPMDTTMVALSEFTDTKMYCCRKYADVYPYTVSDLGYNWFGLESDVDMAIYLAGVIQKAIWGEYRKWRKTPEYKNRPAHTRQVVALNFQIGMAHRLNDRLRDMKEELIKQQDTADSDKRRHMDNQCTDLMVTHKMKTDKVDSEWDEIKPKLHKAARSRHRVDYAARTAGAKAADKVNLSRPIEGGRKGELS